MESNQIELVERTFAKFAPVTTAAGLAFYARLFKLDPSTQSLFRNSIEHQAIMLMQLLGHAVANLHAPDVLLPTVRDLGRRHAGYGVTDTHYDSVGTALFGTLADSLGPAWTPEVEAAWAAAYRMIAIEMKRGAAAEPSG